MPVSNGPGSKDIATLQAFSGVWQFWQKSPYPWMNWFGDWIQQVHCKPEYERLENLRLVKRIVIPGDKRHLYAPIIDLEIIRTNMLDAINKELQLFCEALDRTEKDLKADGAEAGYLLERVATLRESYEREKKTIDILRKKPLNDMRESLE